MTFSGPVLTTHHSGIELGLEAQRSALEAGAEPEYESRSSTIFSDTVDSSLKYDKCRIKKIYENKFTISNIFLKIINHMYANLNLNIIHFRIRLQILMRNNVKLLLPCFFFVDTTFLYHILATYFLDIIPVVVENRV